MLHIEPPAVLSNPPILCSRSPIPLYPRYLSCTGVLTLQFNELVSLPPTIGHLVVGRALDLSENALESLPEGFERIAVGSYLDLSGNQLVALPEGFPALRTG